MLVDLRVATYPNLTALGRGDNTWGPEQHGLFSYPLGWNTVPSIDV